MTLVPDGARKEGGREAVLFRARAEIGTDPGSDGLDAKIDLSGELAIDRATGLVLRIALSGPVEMTGHFEEGGTRFELEGTGCWKAAYTARVE